MSLSHCSFITGRYRMYFKLPEIPKNKPQVTLPTFLGLLRIWRCKVVPSCVSFPLRRCHSYKIAEIHHTGFKAVAT